MSKINPTIISLLFAALIISGGCSGGGSDDGTDTSTPSAESGLTEFQLENGIGPITAPVALDEIDPEMAEQGRTVFGAKCSACHKMDERYVGPALGDAVESRTPAYLMNMILNPDEMVKKHPEARKMLAEYMTPMPFQNVSEDEARAIVEYLRTENQSIN